RLTRELLVGDRASQVTEMVTALSPPASQRRRPRRCEEPGDDRVARRQLSGGGGNARSRHRRRIGRRPALGPYPIEERTSQRFCEVFWLRDGARLIPGHFGAPAAGLHLDKWIRVDGLGAAVPEAVRVVGRRTAQD